MLRIPLLPLLAATAVLLLVACSARPTTYEGRIYFSRMEKSRFLMEWTDPAGREVHPVLPETPDTRSPVPSPDGRTLAFLKGSPPRVQVASLVTGREEQLSTFDGSCSRAGWAMVGSRLAYLNYPPGGRCRLVAQSTSGSPVVIHQARNLGIPTWSRLGNRIFYTETDVAGFPRVWSRKPDGSEPEILLENASEPCTAPDGSGVAVISQGTLHIYELAAKRLRQVLDRPGVSMPSWSPNSKSLAFLLDGQVWTVDARGGDPKQITRIRGGVHDATWGQGL